jgi:prepilin-type N-terminal cleavage/methylation domain-containing protein
MAHIFRSLKMPTSFIRKAFTLVELLVVISIVALLLSLLLPAMQQARYLAEVAVCASTLRQYSIAIISYSTDSREYPTSARMSTFSNIGQGPIPLSPQGEHAGFAGASISYNTTIFKSPVLLLTDGGYISNKGCQCPTKPPPGLMFPYGLWTYSGNIDTPYYCYIGPGAMANVTASYGQTSGLYSYGLMQNWSNNAQGGITFGSDITGAPELFWGCAVKNITQGRAMAGCPSLGKVFDPLNTMWEPHFGAPNTTQGQNGQLSESWRVRRRNYVYTDGHAKFEKVDR